MTSTSVLAEYQFQSIVDTSGQYARFPWGPNINNNGDVLFVAELDNGDFGLYKKTAATTDLVAFSNGTSPYREGQFAIFPDFNDNGDVVFFATSFSRGFGIYTGPDPLNDNVSLETGPFSGYGANPVINNSGTVLFQGRLPGGVNGLYHGDDPVADLYINNSGPFATLSTQIDINNNGAVAFVATMDSGEVGIFRGPNPIADRVVDSNGPFSTVFSTPRLNDLGELAFSATLDSGVVGLFRGPNPISDTIVDSSGGFELFGGAMFNNNGDLIFGALLDDDRIGIFNGPDIDANKIIATGDPLFGSTVVSLNSLRGFNDAGQLVMSYELENGLRGIAIGSQASSGDFDDDGDVDGRDFLVWQRGGSPNSLSSGDLADWQTSYGIGSVSALTSAPEPSGWIAITWALTILAGVRHRSRSLRANF